MLLKKGARISAQDDMGMTGLHLAARQGHDAIAKMLLEWHADPNLVDLSGQSPLHCAVDENHAQLVDVLLAGGADVNLRNAQGQTALHLAADGGNSEILARLLQQDLSCIATRDHFGSTAMCLAIAKGHAASVSVLLDHGEDPNSVM
ncbi:Ankyrin-3 [Metarhizium anisopliae]